jgi:CheY-like chemotaxis protein
LYVDDDADICEIVRASLSLISGIDVRTAASGVQAIDLAYEYRPDLILMDVMMPGLDGPSTLKRIRSSALVSSIPVIFLTAKVMPAELQHYQQLGALGVIGKPFDPMTLGEQLEAVCGAAHAKPADASPPVADSLVAASVAELSVDFIARTRIDALQLRVLTDQLVRGSHEGLRQLEELAHTIHGTAAICGFQQLSAAGGAIERLALQIAAASAPGLPAEAGLLSRLREAVDGLIAAAGE